MKSWSVDIFHTADWHGRKYGRTGCLHAMAYFVTHSRLEEIG